MFMNTRADGGILSVWPGVRDAACQVLIMSFGLFVTGNDVAWSLLHLCSLLTKKDEDESCHILVVPHNLIYYCMFHRSLTVPFVINTLSWILWLFLISLFAACMPFLFLLLWFFSLCCFAFMLLVCQYNVYYINLYKRRVSQKVGWRNILWIWTFVCAPF